MKTISAQLRKAAAKLLFPDNSYCAVCKRLLFSGDIPLCEKCAGKITPPSERVCGSCKGVILPHEFFCANCSPLKEVFASSFCYTDYDETSKRFIREFKYNGYSQAAVYAGRLIAKEMHKEVLHNRADMVLCVPISEKKRAERGYNQADLIAREISRICNIMYPGDVIRMKRMPEDQIGKNFEERRENVRDLFEVPENIEVEGKRILLIDDVVTTASTLTACATPFRERKALSVSFAVYAAAKFALESD